MTNLNLICIWAVSEWTSGTVLWLLLDASKTPESPATDSSLTAADTDLVEGGVGSGGIFSDNGETGGVVGLPSPEPWDMLLLLYSKPAREPLETGEYSRLIEGVSPRSNLSTLWKKFLI